MATTLLIDKFSLTLPIAPAILITTEICHGLSSLGGESNFRAGVEGNGEGLRRLLKTYLNLIHSQSFL